MNNGEKMLPEFVVIGGMKCGSTSLWKYLSSHPDILLPAGIKNLEYYDERDNWNKGLGWYENFFPKYKNKSQVVGEVSTEYSKFPDSINVPRNMASVIPGAKIIYLIRDPYARLQSHYIHMVGAGRENRGLNDALGDLYTNEYINYSRYYYQLEQFLPFYDPKNILVITSEDLKNNRDFVLKKIFHFIGVDQTYKVETEIRENLSVERKKWNNLGLYIRRSASNYNYYSYYKKKFPSLFRYLDYAFCSDVEIEAVSDDIRLNLDAVFDKDIKNLQACFDVDLSRWSFSSDFS